MTTDALKAAVREAAREVFGEDSNPHYVETMAHRLTTALARRGVGVVGDGQSAEMVRLYSIEVAARNISTTLNGGFIRCERCGEQETTTDIDYARELYAALELPTPAPRSDVEAVAPVALTYEEACALKPGDEVVCLDQGDYVSIVSVGKAYKVKRFVEGTAILAGNGGMLFDITPSDCRLFAAVKASAPALAGKVDEAALRDLWAELNDFGDAWESLRKSVGKVLNQGLPAQPGADQ